MASEMDIFRRAMSKDGRFSYLPAEDRHFTAPIKSSLNLAIIGGGIMGQEHSRITEMEGRGRVTAVYDPNPAGPPIIEKIVRSFDPGRKLRVYKSLAEAADDPETDALIICTPNYTHLEVLKPLLSAGKHILLEKPMATKISDANEILNISKNYPGIFQLGLQYRYKANYVEAKNDVLDQKKIGDVKMLFIAERRIPFLDKVGQWNKQSRYSGGTLVEKCCHYFDLFNLFAASRPVCVKASGSQAVNFKEFSYYGKKSDILDNAFVIVEYENGIRACFNLCMFSPMLYEELVICGDRGQLKTWEKEDFLSTTGLETGYELNLGEHGPSRNGRPQYPKFIESSGHSGATFYEHIYFIDNIEGKNTTTATAEEGFWSVLVGVAAELSVKSGKPVYIDELLKNEGIKL